MEELQSVKKIALMSTCLVDQILPEVGVAAVKLLRRLGYQVEFPEAQTCCGQPLYNSGFFEETRGLAQRTIEVFEAYDHVIVPGGSCTAMIRKEYPHLFAGDSKWQARAQALAGKTYELSEFLAGIDNFPVLEKGSLGAVSYHDSCHMNRGLGIKTQPRKLLEMAGYTLVEMAESERCCGFGGLFTVRMPEVSRAMTAEKLKQAGDTGTGVLVSSDPGCLMQMRAASETGQDLRILHLVEVLEEATR